jgi:hypothetical protein
MKKIILSIFALAAALALPCQGETIIALTSGSARLLFFDSATPGTITKTVTVTGLAAGENLLGIDFRPATGVLYALGSTSRIYSINSDTGVATAIGSPGAFNLSGTRFGFDFNPTVDRIRVTSDADQNLRLNPNDGSLSMADGTLAYAPGDSLTGFNPNVVGSAYTNNFSGSGATILYDIDSNFDRLLIQNPPNNGILNSVGALGVDTTDNVGFDISGSTGVLFASLTVGATTNLYTINQLSGAATLVGVIADAATLGTDTVVDIAAGVPPSSKLLNISTRGRVAQGENVLIGGFITRTGVSSRYLLRALGPSLAGFGIAAPLADPVLTLYDNNGAVIATNDDWQASQGADITATGLAPTNNAESAILATLTPSSYTAIVSGKGSAVGIAVVEVYQLP